MKNVLTKCHSNRSICTKTVLIAMKKIAKFIPWFLFIFSFLVLAPEIYDVYHPSDSGDMGALNYHLEIRNAKNGNINSALHLAKYYEYNSEFKKEYEILINLLTYESNKTPSEWNIIIGLSIENCHYTGYMSPEEIKIGFTNAEKQNGLNDDSRELKKRWEKDDFSRCPST